MSTPITAVTDTALAFAEEAAETAIDVASDVASGAADLAADLAVPVVVYGAKKFLTSRMAILVLIGAGVLAGFIVWRRSGETPEETVTSGIPNISDRQPV